MGSLFVEVIKTGRFNTNLSRACRPPSELSKSVCGFAAQSDNPTLSTAPTPLSVCLPLSTAYNSFSPSLPPLINISRRSARRFHLITFLPFTVEEAGEKDKGTHNSRGYVIHGSPLPAKHIRMR